MAEKKEGREGEKKENTERMRQLGGSGGVGEKKMTDRKFRSAPNAQGSIL